MPKELLTLRTTPEFEQMIDQIGEKLRKEGVYGLVRSGKINRSAVLKYLVEREYIQISGELRRIIPQSETE